MSLAFLELHDFTLQARLFARTRWATAAFSPAILLGVLSIFSLVDIQLQIVAVMLPNFLVICVASWLPHGLPPAAAASTALLVFLLGLIDLQRGVQWWQQHAEHPDEVRTIRAVVAWTWGLGQTLVAADIYLSQGTRFWPHLRLGLNVCSSVRFGGVLALYYLGGCEECYPPAQLTFRMGFIYNAIAIAIGVVGLSPTSRRHISEWTGGNKVVLTLGGMRLPDRNPEDELSGGHLEPRSGSSSNSDQSQQSQQQRGQQEQLSESSFCTFSAASTTGIDNDAFAYGPLNAAEFVDSYHDTHHAGL